jgi:ribosomal-protein-alanine N-acetyltransferase
MEQMPYQPDLADAAVPDAVFKVLPSKARSGIRIDETRPDWRDGLPTLQGRKLTLRELRTSDAASLLSTLTTEEVSRFISPPPATVQEFERFITWTHKTRQAGTYACFAVVPEGLDTAVGIFQVRALTSDIRTAEWGFAIGSGFWGSGLFVEGARLVLGFAFDQLGVHRLEARCSVENGRGNGALRKVGAVQEGVLRQSFLKDGRYHDQALYSILAADWRLGQHTLPVLEFDGTVSMLRRKRDVRSCGGRYSRYFRAKPFRTRHDQLDPPELPVPKKVQVH